MRIAICGDTHIGIVNGLGKKNNLGGNTRIDDYEKTLNYVVTYCIENNIDAFVQTGDLFEKRNPTPIELEVADRALRRLSAANVPSFVIMGNHDYKRHGGTYTSALTSLPAKHLPNIRLLINPESIFVSNEKGERVNLVLMPYRDKKMYKERGVQLASEKYENEIIELFDNCNDKFPSVFIGHNFYYEGSYNLYGGTELLANPKCFEKYDVSFMGHNHISREVKGDGNTPCFYTGSMERTNFGEASDEKYLFIYDTITRDVGRVILPTRDLLEISIYAENKKISEVEDFIQETIKKRSIKDKIVRVKISIPDTIASVITKNKIEKLLYDMECYYVSKIIIETIKKSIVRDLSPLKLKNDFDMFKKFLDTQEVEETFMKKVIAKAKELME